MTRRTKSVFDEPEVKEELRELDGILPEGVDRRTFLKASIAGITAPALAGCTGSGGGGGGGGGGSNGGGGSDGGDGTGGGSDQIIRSVIFRDPWRAWPNYAPSHMAEIQGFWADQGISPPSVKAGFGSGDTTNRIGNGVEKFGHASMGAQVSGLAKGLDLTLFGTSKARTQFVMVVNMDQMDGLTAEDMADKTVLGGRGGTAAGELTYELYLLKKGLKDGSGGASDGFQVTTKPSDSADTLFLQGEGPMLWQSINTMAQISFAADFEVGFDPLYPLVPVVGYALMVHTPWLEESDENREYTVRLLSGFSRGLRFCMLQPDEANRLMIEQVNPNLAADDPESLKHRMLSGVVATNLAKEISQDAGLGSILRDPLATTLEEYANGLPDVETTPDIDEVTDFSIQEDADLVTLSNDEWNQAAEAADKYRALFED